MAGVPTQTFTRTDMRKFAATMDNIKRRDIEHSFVNSPLLAIMMSQQLGEFGSIPLKGRGHRVEGGGFAVLRRVTLAEHAGAARMASDFGTHNVDPDSNTRLAEGNWKFYSHGFPMSRHEGLINRGKHKIASFLDQGTRSVLRALGNLAADDLYATTSNSLAVTSIDDLVSAGDSVHGLNGVTHALYNARGLSDVGTAPASVSFASGSWAAQGLTDARRNWNNASEGGVVPDIGLMDYATFERFEGSLQPQERYEGGMMSANSGFRTATFKGTPMVPDRKCTASTLFFLSLDADEGVSFHALSGSDFDFDDWKTSSTQGVMVRPLYLTGTVMIGNRQYGSNKMNAITD